MADDSYSKPSRHKQWQERSSRAAATKSMSKGEIEEHRRNLVNSYQCEDNEITTHFQRITDDDDDDRDECMWLKYKLKCVVSGEPQDREIFTVKMIIPDEIKKRAEDIRRQQTSRMPARKKPMRELPAPADPVIEPPRSLKPKLRKPGAA